MKFHNHLKALHYFSETARFLSIKEAAERLFVSQAAISQQIRLLENALGMPLFHRKHRALALTEEGAKLLPHLELAFDAIDSGVEGLVTVGDPNTIKLSLFPSFAARWLIPRLVRFYESNPSIAINLSMTDKLETFGSDGVDLAIRFGLGDSKDVHSQFLMKEYIYPVCHPTYFKEHNVKSIDDLKRLRLLDDTVSQISWDFWFSEKGIENPFHAKTNQHNRVRYDGSHYVVDSALSAQGVAMARHSLVSESINQKQLVRLFDEPVELKSQFHLCAPKHHFQLPKIQAFTQWVTKEMDEFCQNNPI